MEGEEEEPATGEGERWKRARACRLRMRKSVSSVSDGSCENFGTAKNLPLPVRHAAGGEETATTFKLLRHVDAGAIPGPHAAYQARICRGHTAHPANDTRRPCSLLDRAIRRRRSDRHFPSSVQYIRPLWRW